MVVQATGKALKPVPTVLWKGTGATLAKKNYKVSYTDQNGTASDSITAAGIYTAEISSSGTNYTDTTTATVTVVAKADNNRNLAKGKITIPKNKSKITWTGKEITLDAADIVVKDSKGAVVDPTYYVISYSGNVNPGKATVTATAVDSRTDGYVGSVSAQFTIAKGKTDTGLQFSVNDAVYIKTGAKPAVTVTDTETGAVLEAGKDYTVKYTNNKSATGSDKTAVAKVSGKGNYKFTKTLNFAIAPQDLGELKISVPDLIGTTNLSKVKATITDKSGKALASSDYQLESFNPQTAPEDGSPITVTYKAKGNNYSGSISGTFRVIAKDRDISKANLAGKIKDQIYTGNAVKLSNDDLNGLLYFGKKGSATLVAGTHFKVSGYVDNVKKGTAKVILTGIESKDENGNTVVYGGSKTITFKIVQKKGNWKTGGKILVNGAWVEE